jgi:hypothetical protein
MKRVLILDENIGSGYLTKGRVYDVTEINLFVYDEKIGDHEEINYDSATIGQKFQGSRYIHINDDRGEDEELDEFHADDYIFFENDKDLAHHLVDNVEGLDLVLINLKKVL